MKTSSANLHAAKAAMNSNANSQVAKCAKAHSLPVSKKFYARIRERVLSVVGALGVATDFTDDYCVDVMRLIDRYLAGAMATVTPETCRHDESRVIFLTLRDEIDMAVKRSRRARESAARRRGDAQPSLAPDMNDSATPSQPEQAPASSDALPQSSPAAVPSSPDLPKATPAVTKPQMSKSSFRKLPWKKAERPQPRKLARNRYMRR